MVCAGEIPSGNTTLTKRSSTIRTDVVIGCIWPPDPKTVIIDLFPVAPNGVLGYTRVVDV